MYLHVTPEWLQEICSINDGGEDRMMSSSYPAQISEILALTLENEVLYSEWEEERGGGGERRGKFYR